MKRLIIFTLMLSIPALGWAQKHTNFKSELESKGYTEVEWTYYKSMLAAAKALDALSRTPNGWKVEGPQISKNMSPIKQTEKGFSFGVEREIKSIKKMAAFEKKLLKNNNDPMVPYWIRDSMFVKHPGYSYRAMSARMRGYLSVIEYQDGND